MEATGPSPALLISAGAIVGACCRHYLSGWISSELSAVSFPFPYGTFVVNVLGSIGIGVVSSVLAANPNPQLGLLITTGFLGAFTTFSTYTLESYNLWTLSKRWSSLLYWIGSPVVGLLGLGLGILLGHAIAQIK